MSQNPNFKTPLTIEKASEWSGYSKPYLYKLIHEGKIPSYKPDPSKQGKVFLSKEELSEFIFGKRKAGVVGSESTAGKPDIYTQAEKILNREVA